jgi:hypothetical protein
MAILGWIVSLATFLGGLALCQGAPIPHAMEIAKGLLFAAFLTFPPLWAERPLGITAGQRIMACLAMLLMLPAILLPS